MTDIRSGPPAAPVVRLVGSEPEDGDELATHYAGHLRRNGFVVEVEQDAAPRALPGTDVLVVRVRESDVRLCDLYRSRNADMVIVAVTTGVIPGVAAAFGVGASDCVVHPIPAPELVARIHAQLRRSWIDRAAAY